MLKETRGEERRGEERRERWKTRVLLGRRAKGGWVLSRFALHAPELSAEVAEDPLVRLPRKLITSAILPSLDAAEDHDFDVIRRDDYIPLYRTLVDIIIISSPSHVHRTNIPPDVSDARSSFFLSFSLFDFSFPPLSFLSFFSPLPLSHPWSLCSFPLGPSVRFLLPLSSFHRSGSCLCTAVNREKRSLGFERDPIADDLRAARQLDVLASTSVRFLARPLARPARP